MGRTPCCDKSKVKTGPWSPAEDLLLISYIQKHGHGNWKVLPAQAGLSRCGKSCRLRWVNYLKPGVKRGNITPEEEETILKLNRTYGNRWSFIASQLPGRTDNEIKNVWNTHLKKRLDLGTADNNTSKAAASSPSRNKYHRKPIVMVHQQQHPSSSLSSSLESLNIGTIVDQDEKKMSYVIDQGYSLIHKDVHNERRSGRPITSLMKDGGKESLSPISCISSNGNMDQGFDRSTLMNVNQINLIQGFQIPSVDVGDDEKLWKANNSFGAIQNHEYGYTHERTDDHNELKDFENNSGHEKINVRGGGGEHNEVTTTTATEEDETKKWLKYLELELEGPFEELDQADEPSNNNEHVLVDDQRSSSMDGDCSNPESVDQAKIANYLRDWYAILKEK